MHPSTVRAVLTQFKSRQAFFRDEAADMRFETLKSMYQNVWKIQRAIEKKLSLKKKSSPFIIVVIQDGNNCAKYALQD